MSNECSIAGALAGIVTDGFGRSLPDVYVTAIDLVKETRYTKKTDAEGHFTIPMLLPAEYAVMFAKTGYWKRVVSPIKTEDNHHVTKVDVSLMPEEKCDIAPNGWQCRREKYHSGPCAPEPVYLPMTPGAFFSVDECVILNKLLQGWIVGPSARAVLDKVRETAQR